MPTRDELRNALWRARDWPACLRELAAGLSSLPVAPRVADAAVLLARAFEAIDPDRRGAIEMYLLAWTSRPEASHMARARQLCRELGDLPRAAALAHREHEATGDATIAAEEGLAWLDAGELARAAEALGRAHAGLPNDRGLGIALATARRDWDDPRQVVRELMGKAEQMEPRRGAVALLAAARIIRAYGYEGDDYGGILRRAFAVDPTNDRVYGLLESWMIGRGDRDGLLDTYRKRADLMAEPAALADEYRRAGTRLVTGGYLTGLGLRLLERSVTTAYDVRLSWIPGHIASLTLMREHAEEANLAANLIELVARGAELDLPEHDQLWLCLTGLELSHKRLGAAATARAYAAKVAELAPEHPILQEVMVDQGLVDEPWSEQEEQTDDFLFLDQWVASGEHMLPQGWAPPDRIGLAAAESFDALQLVDEEDHDIPIVIDGATAPPLEIPEPEPSPAPEPVVAAAPEPVVAAAPEPEPAPAPEPEPEPEPEPAPPPPPPPPTKPAAPSISSLIPASALSALNRARSAPLVPAKPAQPAGAVDRAPRHIVPADVRIAGSQQPPISAVTRDLSETGLFLVTDANLTIGADLQIELELPGDQAFAVDEVSLTARVVRKAPEGYGVVFLDPPDDVIARIRAL